MKNDKSQFVVRTSEFIGHLSLVICHLTENARQAAKDFRVSRHGGGGRGSPLLRPHALFTSSEFSHRESREIALLLSELKRRSHYATPLGSHGERSAKCPQIDLRKQLLHISSEMAV